MPPNQYTITGLQSRLHAGTMDRNNDQGDSQIEHAKKKKGYQKDQTIHSPTI